MSKPRLGRLLIVDDEIELTTALCEMLNAQGYEAIGFTSSQDALKALRENHFDLLLTDLMMPEIDGIALLRAALQVDQHLVTIMMTGHGTVQTAVEAMQIGAFDYVLKPFKLRALLPVLDRAMEVRRLRLENVQLRETVAIYELTTTIAYTLDQSTLINKTVEAAMQQLNADEVSLMLPTHEGDELYVAAARGEARGKTLGERLPLEQGIASWVARYRESLTQNGDVNDSSFAPLYPRPDIGSAISMPMLAGGKLVGVLNVNARRRRPSFTLGQVKGLMILASTAAAALESAGLYARVREAEAKYHSIFENVIDGIFQSTPEGRFIMANTALARMLGYASPQDLIASVTDIGSQVYVNPNRRTEFQRLMKESGTIESFESLARRKDGGTIWISENAHAGCDESGNVLYYEGIAEDITARKWSEEALARSEKEFRSLAENAPIGIYRTSTKGEILYVNDSLVQMFGFASPQDIMHAGVIARYKNPADRMAILETIKHEGKVNNRDVELLNKGGEPRNILLSATQEDDVISGMMIDITERKRAEEEIRKLNAELEGRVEERTRQLREAQEKLVHQERLAVLGQLADGVGHELRNPLGVIGNAIYFLRLIQPNPDEKTKEYFSIIENETRTAEKIITDLLDYSRINSVDSEAVTVAELFQRVLERYPAPPAVTVSLKTAARLPPVYADPRQMLQVLGNLVVNAYQAMPEGGKLSLSAKKKGDRTVISVQDTGVGIPPENMAKLFEPLFTTKMHGIGLGLAVCKKLVEANNGQIEVTSTPGKGSTFRVYLPVYKEET